ncbi:MAG: MATE family efflux transporter, partial [Vallitaleaceae bacterium]|nr:MATE family efflux transporter [Vallitaleaceae bacterium]
YLRILFLEMPLLFMLHIFFSVNQAQGDTLTPTIVNGTSAVLNIILDPIFIFTFHLGIEGAAIATVISKLPFAIYAILRMSRGMGFIKIQPIHLRIHVEKMMRLIKIGIPSSLGSSGVSIGFIVLNSVVAGYGDIAMTAMGIGNRLNGLAFMPGVGIGAALSTITAQNLGAGNIPRVKQAFHASLKLAVLFLLLTGSILWIFSGQLVGIFSDTPAVIETGSYYLNILAATTWSIAFFNCSIGLFNGSGHTSYSMLLEAGRLWVIRMPLIIGFAMIPAFKDTGIWLAIGLSNLISSGFAYLLTFNNRWKQARIKTDH